ncbi:MAG: DUF655 domain-containing protein [Candidatus Saliniplasma sp.]
MEDYAYVLDYLAEGRPDQGGYKHESLTLALGEDELKLFELILKEDKTVIIGERLYIGKDVDKREKVKHVKRRIGWDELTHAAQSEVPYVIEEIIDNDEEKFIEFYNVARPITKRYHMLELLPGLGQKKMNAILDERRENGEFKSFEDLEERVPLLHKPKKLIKERILTELKETDIKYKVWVAD